MSLSFHKVGWSAKAAIGVVVASILISISLMSISFILALPAIALILYISISIESGITSFYTGFLFGALSSLILNYWMIPVVTNYAQGSVFLGLLCYLGSSLVLGLFFGLQFCVMYALKFKGSEKLYLFTNAFTAGAVWVLFELIRSKLFSAIPWLSFTIGVTQGRSLYQIQIASFGKVFLLSFTTVVAAYGIADSFRRKSWSLLTFPVGLIALQLIAGFFLYNRISRQEEGAKKVSVAIVMPALDPKSVWNEESANNLVSHLFSLNEEAVKSKPDLVVWTETVVPWTYAPNDDFVLEIAKSTKGTGSHTLIGMNTASNSKDQTLVNSVYFLDPAGKGQARYDKQDLLGMVEKPLLSEEGSLILPFLRTYNLKMTAGEQKGPLTTPWGKAGIILCNESTNSYLAAGLANGGANFLLNIGNDGWFSNHFITRQHFYNNRLRAVENRKDLVVNNNMGFCGIVRASGEIIKEADGRNSGIISAEINPNGHDPASVSWVFCLVIAVLLLPLINCLKCLFINSLIVKQKKV
ncbi:apolipoprotein N-acyltransferase [Desertivirga brevis]|uniref:apolipoprotein N-acyltransferase n=1 Tax=Desertivirga brevis TaxID=2810310 RepID=UPI001A96E84C|nr:apolipoprotein N-acyltransferase [Pedobacter sp. SYSU D00873]